MTLLPRRFLPLSLLAALAGLSIFSLSRASAIRAHWPAEADTLYLPEIGTLRRLALGHTELASDLVAVRANVYYGTQYLSKGKQQHLARYIETAVALDPRFERLYLTGATMLTYDGQNTTIERLEQANGLLARGIEQFPFEWELRFQLGFNQFFELPKIAGESHPRVPLWRQQGLEALRQLTQFENAPEWVPNLVARLLTQRGSQELAIKQLEQAYAVTSNEETRRQIFLNLLRMRQSRMAEQMQEERKQFQEIVDSYPYAPEPFSVLLGPRPKPATRAP